MDFFSLVTERRSVREFREDPVPSEVVHDILLAGSWAPTAGNRQPWHFYVVTDSAQRRALCQAAGGQMFVQKAPVVIVVCADPERSALRYAERGRSLYCLQDTAAAIQNMLLAVEIKGLGACWVGAFDEARATQVLSLPPEHRPVALIPIGHPRARPSTPPRRPVEDIVTFL